jgi:hypothetical protein
MGKHARGELLCPGAYAPVKEWNLRLTGPTLEAVPGKDNTYQVHVAPDGVSTVTTFAEPQQEEGGGHLPSSSMPAATCHRDLLDRSVSSALTLGWNTLSFLICRPKGFLAIIIFQRSPLRGP